jgi:hypothetical protein
MATSESESENNLSDDDQDENGSDDDLEENGSDDDDDENGFDDELEENGSFDDLEENGSNDDMNGMYDEFMNPVYDNDDDSSNSSDNLPTNSKRTRTENSNASPPIVNDSLRMYLIAPPLVRRTVDTKKPCLSIDPTIDELQSKALSTSELYVGNIPHDTKYFELKQLFIDLDYGVSRVNLKTNKVRIVHDFILLLATFIAKMSFRKVIPMPSFGLILLPLRKM